MGDASVGALDFQMEAADVGVGHHLVGVVPLAGGTLKANELLLVAAGRWGDDGRAYREIANVAAAVANQAAGYDNVCVAGTSPSGYFM